jgi:hypothetical protein
MRAFNNISIDSGTEALSHTVGVAINSSDDAEVHHCRFGGNFENSGIDHSGSLADRLFEPRNHLRQQLETLGAGRGQPPSYLLHKPFITRDTTR